MEGSIISKFKKSFLSESPMNIGKGHTDMCQWLSTIINEFITNNYHPIQLDEHYYKLEIKDEIFYWYTDQNKIILAISLEKQSYALIVRNLGKDIKYANKKPFAYELFEVILNDQKIPIRLISDESMTIDGFKNWEKLFDIGYKIYIYNNRTNNAGQSLKQLQSKNEMEEFFKTEKQYGDWQYVISESTGIENIIGPFGLRRIRELSGQVDRDS
jgi:hypothetical protein